MILLPKSASGVVSATASPASSDKKRLRPVSRRPSILKNNSYSTSANKNIGSSYSSDSDSVDSPSKSRHDRETNNVRFQSQHLIPYIHRSDLTVEERQQSWYSRTELAEMKRDAKKATKEAAVVAAAAAATTEIMTIHNREQHGSSQSTTVFCTRGLEDLLNKVERYRRRKHVYRIVVLQQQNQIDRCDSDDDDDGDDDDDDLMTMMGPSAKPPSQIAQDYIIASRQSKIEAYLRAVHDAKYIQDEITNKNSKNASTIQQRTIALVDVVPPPRVAASVA